MQIGGANDVINCSDNGIVAYAMESIYWVKLTKRARASAPGVLLLTPPETVEITPIFTYKISGFFCPYSSVKRDLK
jgi:hypothetical protein